MPRAHQDLRALHLRAAKRGGVVSVQDLSECGFSARAAGRRVERGDWSRVGRAFVLAPQWRIGAVAQPRSGSLGLDDRAWSSILSITYGQHALISGHLALRQAGWSLPVETCIVVMPHEPKSTISGVAVFRRRCGAAYRRVDGVGFTHPREALVDALVVLDRGKAADLLDAALQRRLITPTDFRAAVEPRLGRGCRGAAALRELLERAQTGSRSEAEQRMGVLLKRSRTGPWVANLPVFDEFGDVVAEVDFALRELRIAIEVDGRAHHSDRRSFERDRERQNMLVVRGWLVLRFTWEQITQRPHEVIAAVRDAVAARGGLLRPGSVTG